jgi:peptide/nickel transport system permease protein
MLLRYALKRAALAVPLLFGISLLTFAIVHLAPGGPVQSESAMNPKMSAESIQALKRLYGLDQPLHRQYLDWLGRLARLDFGLSFRDQRPVLDKIKDALPPTLLLNSLSLCIVFGIGVPLGVFSAARPGSAAERWLAHFSFFAYSMPTFWLALLLQLGLGVALGWLPISGYQSLQSWEAGFWNRTLDLAWHAFLPLLVSSFGAWAAISRYMRNSMLEVLGQDYIRSARAKGLSERDVLLRHALPNALLPMITILGLALPGMISGAVIIETIFAWPGMGRLAWEGATGYDYPLVLGLAFIGSVLTVLGNLAADIAYALADPRIRYS